MEEDRSSATKGQKDWQMHLPSERDGVTTEVQCLCALPLHEQG